MSIFDEIMKAIFGLIIFGTLFWLIVQNVLYGNKLNERIKKQDSEIILVKLENVNLKSAQSEMLKQFSVLTELSEAQRKELVASKLSERLTDTDSELNKLKDLMLQTPEKAVKLERVQLKQEAEFKVLNVKIQSLKEQYSTLQSLLYLFVGFVISLLIYIWRQTHVQNSYNKQINKD
jgi:hypothetical protein